MTDTITSLIEKLEEADKPSQELSARMIHAVRVPDGSVEQSRINGRWCVYDKNGRLLENSSRNGWWRESGWEVTESLDAALALAERLGQDVFGMMTDVTERLKRDGWSGFPAPGLQSALARYFCAAVLRAQSEAR